MLCFDEILANSNTDCKTFPCNHTGKPAIFNTLIKYTWLLRFSPLKRISQFSLLFLLILLCFWHEHFFQTMPIENDIR